MPFNFSGLFHLKTSTMEKQVTNKQFYNAILNCSDKVQAELRTIILDNCLDSSLNMIQNEVIKSLMKSKKELIEDEYRNNENLNRTRFAKQIGVSREYVIRIIRTLK
jgi:hypothetical protein